ncbi:MAG TPA: hypothetical protein VNL17_03505 [Verrucomicrobiae bacterium]|nr:hypothetical protein [Verrucomicrobiae bacterium]
MRALALRPLWICLLLALVARLVFAFCLFPILQQRWHLREDGDGYGVIAESIRDRQYTDITRGPVYPMFVAVAGSPSVVKFLQSLLDTVTCWLVFLLAGRNWKAAALWAVYPFAIWRVAFINKEVVLTLLVVAYVFMQLMALRRGKFWQWLAAGGLLALVNLCKPTFLAWPLVVLAIALLHRVPFSRVAALAVAMVVVVAPWTWRNYTVTNGAFLPVATEQGGMTTFIGNYQPTLGLWEGPVKSVWMLAVAEIRLQHPDASVVELDRVYYVAALEQVMRNPLQAAGMFVRKCGRFWFLSAARREQVISFAIQIAYLAMLGIGLWRRWPWEAETVLVLALIAYVMLIHALSYADMRFSLPVMPLVCAWAVAAFQTKSRSTDATVSAAR